MSLDFVCEALYEMFVNIITCPHHPHIVCETLKMYPYLFVVGQIADITWYIIQNLVLHVYNFLQGRDGLYLLDGKRISQLYIPSGKTKKKISKLHGLMNEVCALNVSQNGKKNFNLA